MSVFTVAVGRKIRQENFSVSGKTTISWDLKDESGQPAANGVYFIRFRAGNSSKLGTKYFKVVVAN